MTVIDPFPRTTGLLQRVLHLVKDARVLRVGAALTTCGYQVHEFVADVRDGVPYASVMCTVALTAAEATLLAARLRLDAEEIRLGQGRGAERIKVAGLADMLAAVHGVSTGGEPGP